MFPYYSRIRLIQFNLRIWVAAMQFVYSTEFMVAGSNSIRGLCCDDRRRCFYFGLLSSRIRVLAPDVVSCVSVSAAEVRAGHNVMFVYEIFAGIRICIGFGARRARRWVV